MGGRALDDLRRRWAREALQRGEVAIAAEFARSDAEDGQAPQREPVRGRESPPPQRCGGPTPPPASEAEAVEDASDDPFERLHAEGDRYDHSPVPWRRA